MKTISSSGKTWLLGVQWRYVSAAMMGERSANAHLSEAEKSSSIPHRVSLQDGASLFAAIPKKYRNDFTLSPLVARSLNEGILIAPVGDGSFWMLAFLKGVPLEGHDLIVQGFELEDTLALWLSEVGNLTVFGDHEQAGENRFVLWEDLNHFATGCLDNKSLVAEQRVLDRQQGKKRTMMIAAAAVVLLSGIGYAAWTLINQMDASRKSNTASQQSSQDALARAREKVMAELRIQMEQEISKLKSNSDTMASQGIIGIVDAISQARYESVPGGTVNYIDCNRASTVAMRCQILWGYPEANSSVIKAIYEASEKQGDDASNGSNNSFLGKSFTVDLAHLNNSKVTKQVATKYAKAKIEDQIKVRRLKTTTLGEETEKFIFSPASLKRGNVTLPDPNVQVGETLAFSSAGHVINSTDFENVGDLLDGNAIIHRVFFSQGKVNFQGEFVWLN